MSIAFSIGNEVKKSSFDQRAQRNFPSPGEYNQGSLDSLKSKSPAWKISQAQRMELLKKTYKPGPTEYQSNQTQHLQEGPQFTIGTKQQRTYSNQVPAPGSYSPLSETLNRKGYYFAGRYEDLQLKEKSRLPDPQKYAIHESNSAFNTKEGPQTIGSATRKELFKKESNPAPGEYDPQKFTQSSPQFSLPKAKQENDPMYQSTSKDTPAPGEYKIPQIIGNEGIAVSMVPRRKDLRAKKGLNSPAPGHYNNEIDSVLSKSHNAFTFGQARRTSIQEQIARKQPGPFDHYYENAVLLKKQSPQISFGISPRKTVRIDNKNPPPGTYDLTMDQHKTKGYTIGQKRASLDSQMSPGPIKYSNMEFKGMSANNPPALPFCRAKRFQAHQQKHTNFSPSPGDYQVTSSFDQPQSFFYKTLSSTNFSKAQREHHSFQEVKKKTPGPGYYKIPAKIANTNEYVIPPKNEFKYV